MKFDKARNLVKFLLALCLLFGLAGIIISDKGLAFSVYFSLASMICFVLTFIVIALFCKCPYCGKVVYLGLFKATHCPKCRRNFETGVKKKGQR